LRETRRPSRVERLRREFLSGTRNRGTTARWQASDNEDVVAATGQVSLVAQQVDHGEDLGQAGAEIIGGGEPVRDAGLGDLAFGPGDDPAAEFVTRRRDRSGGPVLV